MSGNTDVEADQQAQRNASGFQVRKDLGSFCLLLVLCSPSACADAEERYGDFSRRSKEVGFDAGPQTPEEPCAAPPPGSIHGPALIAIETTLGAGLPILFLGHASTPEIAGAPHVSLSYRALDATDRKTTVGEALTAGPFPIAEDGAFEAKLPSDTLAGNANPILPGVPITSQLTLTARICGVRSFYCGTVTGDVTSPVQGSLAGRFGLTLLESEQEIPREPRYGCAPEDRAAALAE